MMGIREYDLNYIRDKYVQEAERQRFIHRLCQKPIAKAEETEIELCCHGVMTGILEGIPRLPDPSRF